MNAPDPLRGKGAGALLLALSVLVVIISCEGGVALAAVVFHELLIAAHALGAGR